MRGEKCLLTPNGNESREPDLASRWQDIVRRRSFLHGVAGLAAGAALPATKLFADSKKLSKGDAALLQFAAAAEFIEADLWQQYNELGGAVDHNDNPNPGNPRTSPPCSSWMATCRNTSPITPTMRLVTAIFSTPI